MSAANMEERRKVLAAKQRAYIFRKLGRVARERRPAIPVRVDESTVSVALSSRKYPGLVTLIDASDAHLVAGKTLTPRVSSNTTYVEIRCDGRTLRLHNVIFGTRQGFTVDHINGNGLDNRRGNLRFATARQQAMNRRGNRCASSMFKGVSKKRNRWQARMDSRDVRQATIGHFATEREAALAYDHRARIEYGEFAWLNFPDVVLTEPPRRCGQAASKASKEQ